MKYRHTVAALKAADHYQLNLIFRRITPPIRNYPIIISKRFKPTKRWSRKISQSVTVRHFRTPKPITRTQKPITIAPKI
jgi:hypothetical protein